jgi:3-hydroxyisobutyrate dehydrogenase
MKPDGGPVAFAGLGRMGSAMVARLADAGFDVIATDLRSELRATAAASGVRWAPSIAAAAADAELLFTALPGSAEVTRVVAEAVGSLRSGACWVEMSSASPRVAKAIADTAAPRGVRAIDAPVGGGPREAREGRLLVFAGGDAADLERVRPALHAFSEQVVHVGPTGSGYGVKLLVNALWFTQAVSGAEVLALGRRLGLDLDVLLGALNRSAAGSRFLERDADVLLDGGDLATFSLGRCCEELDTLLAIAGELDVPFEVISSVAQVHSDALARYGDVDGELLGARLVAERAGVDLRR